MVQPLQVNERNGERSSAASEYLAPILNRKNLDVCQGALVERILFDGKKASGVEVNLKRGLLRCAHLAEIHAVPFLTAPPHSKGNKAVTVNLKAGGEVLLAGGAINSPQTLMLSGVGPAEHLQSLGIPLVQDLPGVGENLQVIVRPTPESRA